MAEGEVGLRYLAQGASHVAGLSERLGGQVARETSQPAGSLPGSACTSQWRRRSMRGRPPVLASNHQVIVLANTLPLAVHLDRSESW